MSLLYKVARRLLSVPGVLLRRDTAKDAELLVLRHENAVLRRQLAGPVRYEPEDRFWLTALSALIPRRRWREVFPVAPGTLLAWHRRLITTRWESSVIEHDARQFPGWDRATGDIRFDVQTFISENGRYMEVMSVNAGPAESRTRGGPSVSAAGSAIPTPSTPTSMSSGAIDSAGSSMNMPRSHRVAEYSAPTRSTTTAPRTRRLHKGAIAEHQRQVRL